MRWTLLLLLANFAAALFLASLYRHDEASVRHQHLFVLNSEEVTYIHIERSSEILTLAKRGTRWWITQPLEWPANPFAVQRILNHLVLLESDIRLPLSELGEHTLADYGLAPPAFTVCLGNDQDKQALAIGSATGLGNRLYVMKSGADNLAMVPREGFESILQQLSSLRGENIFDIPLYAVEAITIRLRDPELTLRLVKTNGEWHFESPIATAADNERVETLLNLLSSLKVARFVEPSAQTEATTRLESPSMRITLSGHNQQQTLLLGSPDETTDIPRLYARLERSPTVFSVMAEPFTNLRTRWEALREHRIARFDPALINAIDIRRGERSLSLQKLETGPWQIVRDNETLAADTDTVQGLLNHLKSLQAVRFISDAPSQNDLKNAGLTPPSGEIRLRGSETLTLQLGALDPKDDLRTVATSGAPSLFGVEEKTLQLIEAEPYAYRSRRLLELPETATVENLTLQVLGDQRPVALTDASVPLALGETLKQQLHTFEAQAFVPGEADAHGFRLRESETSHQWTLLLTLTIGLPGGEATQLRTHAYYLSDLGSSPVYAIATDSSQPFLLPEGLVANLRTLAATAASNATP